MGRWARRSVTALVVVLAAVLIGLSGWAGSLYWLRSSTTAAQETRAQLEQLAAEQVPMVFGYDYQTVESSLTDAYLLLAPEYRREFEERSKQDIIPEARERQVISQANVVGVGVMEARRNSGSVLVFMNRTITDKRKEPAYQGSRLRVDYRKIDGDWLIEYITPI